MFIVENIKRKLEQATGIAKPSLQQTRDAVREIEPQKFAFPDDGAVPNNPTLPFLVYKGAVQLDGVHDPAAVFEALFQTNGWGNCWRNGI